MKEFVIKFPSWVLVIIVFIGALAGGSAIIWMLFGYFLGVRAESIAHVSDAFIERIKERSKE